MLLRLNESLFAHIHDSHLFLLRTGLGGCTGRVHTAWVSDTTLSGLAVWEGSELWKHAPGVSVYTHTHMCTPLHGLGIGIARRSETARRHL